VFPLRQAGRRLDCRHASYRASRDPGCATSSDAARQPPRGCFFRRRRVPCFRAVAKACRPGRDRPARFRKRKRGTLMKKPGPSSLQPPASSLQPPASSLPQSRYTLMHIDLRPFSVKTVSKTRDSGAFGSKTEKSDQKRRVSPCLSYQDGGKSALARRERGSGRPKGRFFAPRPKPVFSKCTRGPR